MGLCCIWRRTTWAWFVKAKTFKCKTLPLIIPQTVDSKRTWCIIMPRHDKGVKQLQYLLSLVHNLYNDGYHELNCNKSCLLLFYQRSFTSYTFIKDKYMSSLQWIRKMFITNETSDSLHYSPQPINTRHLLCLSSFFL